MSLKNVKADDFEKSTVAYFNEIKNTSPLSKKEEKVLWKRFHEHHDMSAREKLIKANLKFVPTVAKQFTGCGLPFADIVEEGNVGLIKAIDRFDPKRDTKVISYAVWWIRKCILEAIEKRGMLDADNIDDLYKCGIDDDEMEVDENKNQVPVLDKNQYYNDVNNNFNPKQIVEDLFEGIPERERSIISDYYGLYGDSPKTLDEIGLEVNLTRERVRQLNEKALKKMRSNALMKKINFTSC
jgi:RNA polymerase primary sigma factor